VNQAERGAIMRDARAAPGHTTLQANRPRIHDDEPNRAAAIRLCQAALDAWLRLPDDAHANTVNAAREKLREALGLLGAVTGRRVAVSPYGRQPAQNPASGFGRLLGR
jgi:hypothetical protein